MGRTGSQRQSGMSKSQRLNSSQKYTQREIDSQEASGSQTQMSSEDIDIAAKRVFSYIMSDLMNKKKIRKKEDIVNNVLESGRQYAAIMKRVQCILQEVCGLQMAKLPPHANGKQDDSFIIVNKHGERFRQLIPPTDTESIDYLILTVVLSSILMNRGNMYESHLMYVLETIGFLDDSFYAKVPSRPKNVKEYVKKLVKNTFVKHMYLESVLVARPEQLQQPPLSDADKGKVLVFQWGFRSLLEVKVEDVANYLTKMYDGKRPASFPVSTYNEMKARQEALLNNL